MPKSDVARADSPAIASYHPSHPQFLPRVHQSVHDIFVRLETCVCHIYDHREKGVEQERHEHAPLTKALSRSELPRAYPVVEPHACSHAIMELTNDRPHTLWHAKTGEYCPEESLDNGFDILVLNVDEAYIELSSFLLRQLL